MITLFFNAESIATFNLNYPDTLKKHFNRLKDELIPCPICNRPIIYTKYHKHLNEECDGEEQEDFDGNENSSEEQNKMDESNLLETFNNQNDKKLDLLKCKICEQFARDPFYICTHKYCLDNSVIFCCECYEDNIKRNKKTDGECVFDHMNNMGVNGIFVQRYDCLIEPIDIKIKNVIKRIVCTKFPAHYTFLFELNEYYKNYREDEYAEERSSSESEMQKESRKIRNRFLNAFKNFSMSGAELYIANYDSKSKIMRLLDSDFISKLKKYQNDQELIEKRISNLNSEIGSDSSRLLRRIDEHENNSDQEEEIKNNNLINTEMKQLNSEKERLDNFKFGSDCPVSQQVEDQTVFYKIRNLVIVDRAGKRKWEDVKKYDREQLKDEIELSMLLKKEIEGTKNKLEYFKQREDELMIANNALNKYNISLCNQEWLKNISEEKLTKENIKILAQEIYNHEPVLAFQEFSQYNHNYMSFINSKKPSCEIALRGRYDVKTCIQNADKCFCLFCASNSEQNFLFNACCLEIDNLSIRDLYYNCFYNLKDNGLSELNYRKQEDLNKFPFELSTDHFDFKVIRTSISNRTFAIGGIDHSQIKEIKASSKNISIVPLPNSCVIIINEGFSVYDEIHDAFKVKRSERLRNIKDDADLQNFKENELLKLDKLIQKMIDTDVNEVVQTLMSNDDFLENIFENCFAWIEDFSFDPKETIINKISEKINHESMKAFIGFEEASKHTIHKLLSSTIDKMKEKYSKYKSGLSEGIRKRSQDNNEQEEYKIMIDGEEIDSKEYKFIWKSIFLPVMKRYFQECVNYKLEQIKKELKQIRRKMTTNLVETTVPRYNHSVTATKDFVFITGGETETNEDTFDILVLKDNFIVKGPNLNYKRKRHCSFIIKNYLYVLFGEVENNFKTSISYERIEIPSFSTEISIRDFYLTRQWSYEEIDFKFRRKYYIQSFNCFKDIGNTIYCFGEKCEKNSPGILIKIVAKYQIGNNKFELTLEKINSLENQEEAVYKEKVHIPFTDKGDWYLPIISKRYNMIAKWNEDLQKFDLKETD